MGKGTGIAAEAGNRQRFHERNPAGPCSVRQKKPVCGKTDEETVWERKKKSAGSGVSCAGSNGKTGKIPPASAVCNAGRFCPDCGGSCDRADKKYFFRKPVDPKTVEVPGWVKEDLLTPNPYSRPGTPLEKVNGIVVHYVANPCSTARENRNYFENLKDQTGSETTSVSSHFVIGLEGEIIQCIPLGEVAYASNNRNSDTISIECCHPDETGKFYDSTYQSLVNLCAYLCTEFNLKPEDVIRHYDVTGKICPKYFVDHPEEWENFMRI